MNTRKRFLKTAAAAAGAVFGWEKPAEQHEQRREGTAYSREALRSRRPPSGSSTTPDACPRAGAQHRPRSTRSKVGAPLGGAIRSCSRAVGADAQDDVEPVAARETRSAPRRQGRRWSGSRFRRDCRPPDGRGFAGPPQKSTPVPHPFRARGIRRLRCHDATPHAGSQNHKESNEKATRGRATQDWITQSSQTYTRGGALLVGFASCDGLRCQQAAGAVLLPFSRSDKQKRDPEQQCSQPCGKKDTIDWDLSTPAASHSWVTIVFRSPGMARSPVDSRPRVELTRVPTPVSNRFGASASSRASQKGVWRHAQQAEARCETTPEYRR